MRDGEIAAPRPSRSAEAGYDYDQIAAGYYDRVFRRRFGAQSKWHHLKFERVRSAMPPGSRHLDIACGPGTFVGTLPRETTSLGVDIAGEQVRYAEATYGGANKHFAQVSDGPLPVASDRFDVVTCIELLEHLPRETGLRLMREARRVLKPGGRLITTTPDYGGLWPLLEWGLNRVGDVSYEDQHITHFTRRALHDLLTEAGFETVDVSRYQWLAPFAAVASWRLADWIARLEPNFLTRRIGFLLIAQAQ